MAPQRAIPASAPGEDRDSCQRQREADADRHAVRKDELREEAFEVADEGHGQEDAPERHARLTAA